jgi:hypothetical protein
VWLQLSPNFGSCRFPESKPDEDRRGIVARFEALAVRFGLVGTQGAECGQEAVLQNTGEKACRRVEAVWFDEAEEAVGHQQDG